MRCIGLASAAMKSRKNIWNNRQLNTGTKDHVYHALLYAWEIRTLLAADIRRLEAFHMRCLRVAPTHEHYLVESHHQWGNPVNNRTHAIARYPVRHCLVMSPDSIQMFLHTKLYGCSRTFPLVESPTSDGDRHLVDRPPQILTDVGMSPRNYWDACIHRDHSAWSEASRWWWWWWWWWCWKLNSPVSIALRPPEVAEMALTLNNWRRRYLENKNKY